MSEWRQPVTMEEVRAVLRQCVVRRERSKFDAWYMIEHTPTGQRISGPPQDFMHPYLRKNTPYCARRWRTPKEAKAALAALHDMANSVEHTTDSQQLNLLPDAT